METDYLIANANSNGNGQKRRPYHYQEVNKTYLNGNIESDEEQPNLIDESERANYSRFRYYSRLRRSVPEDDDLLLIPSHVVPNEFFSSGFYTTDDGKQSSIITIFSLWNTMMGTSMLSMPWAMEHSGVIPAIILLTAFSALSFYCAYRIIQVYEAYESNVITDFAILCNRLLGNWAQVIAVIFSALVILGACIVYWVLMSNFLYHTVDFIHSAMTSQEPIANQSNIDTVYCPSFDNSTESELTSSSDQNDTYHKVWDLYKTVPFFLILILGPIASIRSPTFFTKFNSLGTLSVLYLAFFVFTKWNKYGINVDFHDETSIHYTPLYKSNFPALTGTLSMAFFIHNCIITIMKNNRVKENNKRDLGIAFIFVAFSYLILGGLFYLVFPLDKTCIEDNFLNNFHSWDIYSFAARVFLFFQLVTVFPLLTYILRVQVWYSLTRAEPNQRQVYLTNFIIITICICFAIWLPKIGTIIRFTGAICGLVYLFFLPICLYLRWKNNLGTLTKTNTLLHLGLLSLGVTNFVLQFVVVED